MNAYKNLKTYVLSALAGVAMMANAQAQEIGAQYRDKEAAGTAEYSFNIAKDLAITPRVEVGSVSDASLRLDLNKDKMMAYIGAGMLKGEEMYPMVIGGVAFNINKAFTAYANGAAGFGAKEESTEDPQKKFNAGLEYKTKLLDRNLALRAGIVDKIGTDESKIGPDLEANYSLTKDDTLQLSAGYEGDTARAGLVYNFGKAPKRMPGRLNSASLGKKTAYQTVGEYNGEPVVQTTQPNGNVSYTIGDTPVTSSTTEGSTTYTPVTPTPTTGENKPYEPNIVTVDGGTSVTPTTTPVSGGGSGIQTNTENPDGATDDNKPNQGGSTDPPVVFNPGNL